MSYSSSVQNPDSLNPTVYFTNGPIKDGDDLSQRGAVDSISERTSEKRSSKKNSKPSIKLIRMEQLAPDGSIITNSSDSTWFVKVEFYELSIDFRVFLGSNSLKDILRKRLVDRQSHTNISERVQRFYESQDDLVNGYEIFEKRANNDEDAQAEFENENNQMKRLTNILARASLAVNIVNSFAIFSENV